jgi:hypothetical protein
MPIPQHGGSHAPTPVTSARRAPYVQVAVDTEHHLIVTHEVTNTGSDRSQLAKVAPRDRRASLRYVLAYNLTRVMNILGVKPLIAAIQT